MDANYARVRPETSIRPGAVRTIGRRPRRGPKKEQEFEEELAKREESASSPAARQHDEPLEQASKRLPPSVPDGDVGTRLDVTG